MSYELKLRDEPGRERYAVVSGSVFKKPEVKELQNNNKVSTITLALYNGKDATGNYRDSTFIDCKCWGDLADMTNNLNVREKITVWGNIKHESWNDKTTNKKVTKLVIEVVGFKPVPVNSGNETLG